MAYIPAPLLTLGGAGAGQGWALSSGTLGSLGVLAHHGILKSVTVLLPCSMPCSANGPYVRAKPHRRGGRPGRADSDQMARVTAVDGQPSKVRYQWRPGPLDMDPVCRELLL